MIIYSFSVINELQQQFLKFNFTVTKPISAWLSHALLFVPGKRNVW